jgi:catechol 2,3-dioxygenase
MTAPGVPARAGAPIHPETGIGAVHLTVRRLDRAAAFYRDRLGLAFLEAGAGLVRLGAGGRTLVVLHGDTGAAVVERATGLYHLAILLPSRADLAAVLRHLAATRTPLSGASDHLVSEALYLDDPEGNGIEIYRDRPRAEWRIDATGAVSMTTRALDIDALLAEPEPAGSGPWRMPDGAAIGHVHLKVSDVLQAERFYVDALGFALTARYGHAASFVSAGGYHHHIGFNMWESAGAPPPPAGAAGLAWFEVRLPHQAARDAVVDRLRAAGLALDAGDDNAVMVRDPAGNRLALTLP